MTAIDNTLATGAEEPNKVTSRPAQSVTGTTSSPDHGQADSSVWHQPDGGVLTGIARAIDSWGIHPATVLVLLPFGQLLGRVTRLWAAFSPDGFSPRFETTLTWANALGAQAASTPGSADDFRFDAALDSLTARALLERAGLGDVAGELAPRLLQASAMLASRAAAVPPEQRNHWAACAGGALDALQGGVAAPDVLRLEAAITRLALAWAAASSYGTDALWDATRHSLETTSGLQALVILEGFQPDPLTTALAARFGERVARLPLVAPAARGHVSCYAAQDFEQEAQWAAACLIRQVESVRLWQDVAATDLTLPPREVIPVALVATDRTLTRRVRALIESAGLPVRDETGWTLSTTRAAATLMTQLEACRWRASSDAVLDWLKNSPAFAEHLVSRLEVRLRQDRCRLWRDRDLAQSGGESDARSDADLIAFTDQVQHVLERMRAARSLRQWLVDLMAHLESSAVWPLLQSDIAGQAIIRALHLGPSAQNAMAEWPLATRRMRLDDFTAWVRQTLEAGSFVPPPAAQAQVVILPLSQLLARPFAGVVMPACDERRLSAAPDLPGNWTDAERQAMGLPTRADHAEALCTAWDQALQFGVVDLLHRQNDSGGEALMRSPLLLRLLQSAGHVVVDQPHDPRRWRECRTVPTLQPGPSGSALGLRRLSASAYEDLRRCPYRFFALRQLGLKEASELDSELEKRDFGDWLHEVLKDFHEGLLADPQRDRGALIDLCARQSMARRRFSPGEFLPYMAAWPAMRDGYLNWLSRHEAAGVRFASAESWHETGLGRLTLTGRIDRIDRVGSQASGQSAKGDVAGSAPTAAGVYLIDYKTEPSARTKSRLLRPLEDTQLAFYAALLPDDSLRAAYLNLGEREGTRDFEHTSVVECRDALIEGILDDMQRIAGGAVLAALGEGSACAYCAARGLCRKDFWAQP
jgi:ATP-dependent helicase/nuclease subunit B